MRADAIIEYPQVLEAIHHVSEVKVTVDLANSRCFPHPNSSPDDVLSLNIKYDEKIFIQLKDWYDLGWNNERGVEYYTSQPKGYLIISQYDNEDKIIRRTNWKKILLKNLSLAEGLIHIEFTAVSFSEDYF